MKNTGGANSLEVNNICPITQEELTADNTNDFILVKVIRPDSLTCYFIHTSVQNQFFGLDKCPITNATEEYKALYLKDLSQELQSEVIKLTDNTEFTLFFAKEELQYHIKIGTFKFKTVAKNQVTTLDDFINLINSYLLQLDAHLDNNGHTVLIWSAYHGRTEKVGALLDKGADVNAADEQGSTALIRAAEKGHIDIVKALLDKNGIKVNAGNQYGHTALMLVAGMGNTAIVNAFLDKEGIEVNAEDEQGSTALILAAAKGHTDTVSALLEKGANVNAADKHGYTALWVAAQNGHTYIVKALLEKGANVNAANQQGITALIIAAQKGHTDIVNALLDKDGIVVDAADKCRKTALSVAKKRGHRKIVKALRDAGAKELVVEPLVIGSSIFTHNRLASEESKDSSEQSNHKPGHTPAK